MTQGEGQANVPTTRFLLTPSPYLQGQTQARLCARSPQTLGGATQSEGHQGSGRMATVGRAQAPRQGRSALQALTFPLIPTLVLMSPFSQKQKSW